MAAEAGCAFKPHDDFVVFLEKTLKGKVFCLVAVLLINMPTVLVTSKCVSWHKSCCSAMVSKLLLKLLKSFVYHCRKAIQH